ncbi:unnamed protein product [Brachionus calyciflorus]|uniref:Peptidase A2 domain-containing protein n=1 Tax=Brachionus calyciflorus TaxID=104777 RepID=A0A814BPH1_9BILA|nr:unnamed protein product [Brachionus calyciflorus]
MKIFDYVTDVIKFLAYTVYKKPSFEEQLKRKKTPLDIHTPFNQIMDVVIEKINTYYFKTRYLEYIWYTIIGIILLKVIQIIINKTSWLPWSYNKQYNYIIKSKGPSIFTINQDFHVWKRGFERHAKNLSNRTQQLLSLLEEECLEKLEQRLLFRKPNATYDEIIQTLEKLFGKNQIYNDPFLEFSLREQSPNENVYQYMCELENLAAKAYLAENDNSREKIIVDRFIRGLNDVRVQSELCQVKNINSIEQALDQATQLEDGFQRCKSIIQTKTHHVKSITEPISTNQNNNFQTNTNSYDNNRSNYTNKNFGSFKTHNNSMQTITKNQTLVQNDPNSQCTHCVHHKHLWKNCYFNPINMNKDVKHFKKLRFNLPNKSNYIPHREPKIKTICKPPFCEATNTQIEQYSTDISEHLEGDCLINNRFTRFQIDTGSDISVISEKVFNQLTNKQQLLKTNEKISGADGSNLRILGRTLVKIQFGNYMTNLLVYVMSGLVKEFLIGLDFVNKFNGFKIPISHLKNTLNNYTRNTISINLRNHQENLNTIKGCLSRDQTTELNQQNSEQTVKIINADNSNVSNEMPTNQT